jgi:hypothetical protein
VGSPLCVGRGPLVIRFEIEGKQMGLVCSRAISADVPSRGSIFRYVSGLFNEPDYIECVRTGTKIPTISTGDVLFVQTSGFAEDISPSEEFKD